MREMRKEENMDIPEYYPPPRNRELSESLNRIENTMEELAKREYNLEQFRRTYAEIRMLSETPENKN